MPGHANSIPGMLSPSKWPLPLCPWMFLWGSTSIDPLDPARATVLLGIINNTTKLLLPIKPDTLGKKKALHELEDL